MMHKERVDLNLETLKKCAPEQLQTQPVAAVLLALGSNYQAEKHLLRVRESLATIGEIELSIAFQNPDFTATPELPKPAYTNQCVYLILTAPLTLQQLQQRFKKFERDCHRQRLTELQTPVKQVTMDIDILLIRLANNINSLSNKDESEWIVMADRYPFKAHERAGLKELIVTKKIDC
ncbi:2-amino-4-hydroxy-6-hydroxymethyldihydropteridine diphosphokinase [Psychrobacter sp. AOP3-A1-26]|uniref:2-amino-4-hydroxy-6- hydroxymethyldihydropteridine diphosphokinase n=1 Tax=Psychrobacter sp. AOP3-A1-26 TaxID=3457700 RepID=UPI004036CD17